MKAVSFGEILLRLAAPGYTKLFQKDSLDASFCGAEANVAVSLSIFGIHSAFVTKLPKDPIGQAAVNSMRYFGVDTTNIQYGNGRMGLYYLEKGASQRSSKIIYDREYSAIARAKREDFNWESILDGANWFHWTGISPALSNDVAEICLDACRIAKEKKITISCDLNYRKNLWSSDKANKIMTQLMPYVDVCIANEEDAEKVLGLSIVDNHVQKGRLNRKGYETVAEIICDKFGCKVVAFTFRESYSASVNGWSAMLYDSVAKEAYYSRKYEIQIVDRVGGGDSFTAGIIYGLLVGKTKQDVVDFAAAASCLKQTIEGDYNRTSLQDVDNLLKNGGSGRIER